MQGPGSNLDLRGAPAYSLSAVPKEPEAFKSRKLAAHRVINNHVHIMRFQFTHSSY